MSQLASWLRTRRFSEPPFRPSGATNPWKNTMFCDIPTFSGTWIFFLLGRSFFIFSLLLLSSLTLPVSAFHLSLLPEVGLVNFLGNSFTKMYKAHRLQRCNHVESSEGMFDI